MQFFKKIAICCCIPLFIVACSSSDDDKPTNSPTTPLTPIIIDPTPEPEIIDVITDHIGVNIFETHHDLDIYPHGSLYINVTEWFDGKAKLDKTSALQTTNWIHREYSDVEEDDGPKIIYEEDEDPIEIVSEGVAKIDRIMSKTEKDYDNGKKKGDYLYKYTRVITSINEMDYLTKDDDGKLILSSEFRIVEADILNTARPTDETMDQLTKIDAEYVYTGSVFGMVPNPEKIGHEGNLTLTAKFGERKITGDVEFNGSDNYKPANFGFTGKIDEYNTGKFSGDTDHHGIIWGAFTGPEAQEMGGSYENQNSQGVFIGHKKEEDK